MRTRAQNSNKSIPGARGRLAGNILFLAVSQPLRPAQTSRAVVPEHAQPFSAPNDTSAGATPPLCVAPVRQRCGSGSGGVFDLSSRSSMLFCFQLLTSTHLYCRLLRKRSTGGPPRVGTRAPRRLAVEVTKSWLLVAPAYRYFSSIWTRARSARRVLVFVENHGSRLTCILQPKLARI